MRTPHLRDFAADSRGEAFRLADLLVHSAAQDLGVRLAEPTPRVPVSLDFTGVPDPDAFRAELHTLVDAKDSADVESGPDALAHGAQLSVTGRAHDAAMIIVRSIVGFGVARSAHMVRSRPVEHWPLASAQGVVRCSLPAWLLWWFRRLPVHGLGVT